MPTEASGVPFSKSVQRCVSGSLMVHGQGLVILSVRSKRTVATGEFHAHKGLGLFPEQQPEIKHVVKPGSLTVGLEREPESVLPLDRQRCTRWWVGAQTGGCKEALLGEDEAALLA